MEEEKKNHTRLWTVIIVLLGLAIAGVILNYSLNRPEAEIPAVTPRPTTAVVVREKEVEKIVEKEKVITAEVIQDGLRDMGKLVTQEYYFTEVVNYSIMSEILGIKIKMTEASFLASYDGVIYAGIDFTGIAVEKDDELKTITVRLPDAEILSVDIDPESLVVYSEKQGIGNRITLEDYNNSLIGLEKDAKDKAIGKGILERADENAEKIVRTFIGSLVDTDEYVLLFN